MHRNTAADKENYGQEQIKFSHGEIAGRAYQFWKRQASRLDGTQSFGHMETPQ